MHKNMSFCATSIPSFIAYRLAPHWHVTIGTCYSWTLGWASSIIDDVLTRLLMDHIYILKRLMEIDPFDALIVWLIGWLIVWLRAVLLQIWFDIDIWTWKIHCRILGLEYYATTWFIWFAWVTAFDYTLFDEAFSMTLVGWCLVLVHIK